MNYYVRACLLFLISCSFTVNAEPVISGNYWQCVTYDKTNKKWSAVSLYQRVALNFSLLSCKKESTIPGSCRASHEYCEQFVNGVSIKPMWRCTAFDWTPTPWRANDYSQREDAALAAKAYCQQHSPLPGTCFINLITCVNRNSSSR